MLKKQNRLTTKFEYNITRKYGKKINTEIFTLYYLQPRNYDGSTKVGFVTTTKLEKSAAKRNKIKRLFREAAKNCFDKLPPKNLWVVIHPTRLSLQKSYEEISTSINKVLSEISVA